MDLLDKSQPRYSKGFITSKSSTCLYFGLIFSMIKVVMVVAAAAMGAVAATGVEAEVVVVEAASAADVVVVAEVAGVVNPQIGTATPTLKNSVNFSLVDCPRTHQKIQ